MSAPPPERTADVAARQVEQIVAAAQEAAEQIRAEARQELLELRGRAEREVEEIRAGARREGEQELNAAREEAVMLTQDARREAEGILADANAKSAEIRDRTERAVQGRVASAERAAADVLAEARALSGGLHQLGRSLEDYAERILRDVAAAHKRMQADLRVSGPARERAQPAGEEPGEEHEPRFPRSSPGAGRGHANPFDDLEVPAWE